MAGPETRAAIAGGRPAAARAKAPAGAVGPSNEERAEQQAAVFDAVRNSVVTIGGVERRLHELAPRYQRRLTGLFTRIGDEARGTGLALDRNQLGRRFVAIINERYTSDVLELTAIASKPPGELGPADVGQSVEALEDSVTFAEVGNLMMTLLALNGFLPTTEAAAAPERPT